MSPERPEFSESLFREFGLDYRSRDTLPPRVLRPHPEYAAHRAWHMGALDHLTFDEMVALSRILGGRAAIRTGRQTTFQFASGQRLQFADAAEVRPRLARLLDDFNTPLAGRLPLAHATLLYIDFLTIHPFKDGNGRMARLLFQLSLAKTCGLRAPVVPLMPYLKANGTRAMHAYLQYELRSNGVYLAGLMVDAVCETTAAVGKYLG